MKVDSAIVDDLSRDPPLSAIGTRWQLFTDWVMGGVSNGTMVREMVAGRPAIRMRGDVSLEEMAVLFRSHSISQLTAKPLMPALGMGLNLTSSATTRSTIFTCVPRV